MEYSLRGWGDCDLERVGEAAEADELLDDGHEVVLLDGPALRDRPLLQHGSQREARPARVPYGNDAAVE